MTLTSTSASVLSPLLGVTQTISVWDTKVAETVVSPNLHERVFEKAKFEPLTVTLDPPVEGPVDGEMAETATGST